MKPRFCSSDPVRQLRSTAPSEGAASNDISVTAVATVTVTLPLNSDVSPPRVAVAVSGVPPPTPPGTGTLNANRFVVSVPCAMPLTSPGP